MNSLTPSFWRARKDPMLADHIPYTAHIANSVVRTESGDYVQTFRLGGASFETADDRDLNVRHARLNVLWRTLASPNLAVWTHVVRRHVSIDASPAAGAGFADRFRDRYQQRIAGRRLMQNDLYISLVYRPVAGRTSSVAARLLARTDDKSAKHELAASLENTEHLRQSVLEQLAPYDPEPLGVVQRDGKDYSTLLEFFALLVSSVPRSVPLPRAPVKGVLAAGRPIFGAEVIEYRLPQATRVGAMLGIQEYATPTAPGMLDPLLSAPFPFVLTQSFAFLSRPAAQGLLVRQHNQLRNAGDFAVSQAEALHVALDELSSGEWVMGDHHWTLQVLADLAQETAADETSRRLTPLNDHIAAAAALLVDTQFAFAREDLGMEAAWWSQLPGMFRLRPRKAPISSRNFAALSSFHNYPVGKAHGNHWGDAAALLITSARSPFCFSLHASDPREEGGGARRDNGHTLVLGPTGSGKTVWIAFLILMLERFGTLQVIIDKNRGLEVLVRALGGEYAQLRNGVPTGMNPLQLPATPENVAFLRHWLRVLVRRPDRPLSAREEAEIDQALRGALALEPHVRRLSRVLEFLDVTDPNGLCARLAPWCEVAGGEDAWAFDQSPDLFFSTHPRGVAGFDVTDFLDNDRVRTPITLYLFHFVRSLLGQRRVVCWADEFSRLINDDAFVDFAQDGLQVWRKLEGVFGAAAQSPSSVLSSRIARVVLEQTATKMFMPNPDATYEDYVTGCGLTEREFRLVQQELRPGSCLIRQGHRSLVCQLDLRGCDDDLAVMSSRSGTVALMHQLIDRLGPDPAAWLPAFTATYRSIAA